MSAFDVAFQRAVLRLCMVDEIFNDRAMEHLDPSYFTTQAHGWIFKVLHWYHETYGQRCTDIPLRDAVRRHGDRAQPFASEVERVIDLKDVAEENYIRAELQEFIRRSAFARAHKESMELWNRGQHDGAYDAMQNAMETVRNISFDEVDRSWFFDTLHQRQEQRIRDSVDPTKGAFPTGFKDLDNLLNGGLHTGEVFLVLGDAKVGKTTWLLNQTFAAARISRAKTLYINLEGSLKQIEDRLDARFSQEEYRKIRTGEIDTQLWREMVAEYSSQRGRLVLRALTDWDVNILHIEAELQALKSHGFVPDVIILDYVDLLRSRHRVDGETQHQIDSMKDFKQLANRGYACWSGCQGRRPKSAGKKKSLLRSKDIADAYGKIRIADAYGSLNATDQEIQDDQTRYFQENYRDAPVGRTYFMQNDRSRMTLGTVFEEYVEEAAE